MKDTVIIAGAGLTGATVARILAEKSVKVKIFEKRPHIAGNVYDRFADNGVLVQMYGAHLFHTNAKRVMDFLTKFSAFYPYHHTVLANIRGTHVPVPFQFESIRRVFPHEKAGEMIRILKDAYGEEARIPILELRKREEPLLAELAGYIYENIFSHYTAKQWQMSLSDLDPSVGGRVPVVVSEKDGYFADKYQCMPENGFTGLVQRILDHPLISVVCSCDMLDHVTLHDGAVLLDGEPFKGRVVYSGCIDELFSFSCGHLPYRSLRFDVQDLLQDHFQPSGVVNYTVSEDYTRILEFKYFMKAPPSGVTTIAYEYPCAFDGTNIPYYPVPGEERRILYRLYTNELAKYPQITALGRLAQYRYYNMDEAVAAALDAADAFS